MNLPAEYLIYTIIALTTFVIILLAWAVRMEIKMRRVLRGKSAADLESSILSIYKDADENKKFRKDMENYLRQVEKRLSRSIQSTATVKFDAFKGTGSGGNQSFATAYLSENGGGVIISALAARDRVSIFTRPIENFQCKQELSPEESEVLLRAKENL